MDRVVAGEELTGLADMIAAILRGNLEADPARAQLLDRAKGSIALRAPDVEAGAALLFSGGVVKVFNDPKGKPDVEIVADSEQMMAFSTVPRRFGKPDLMAAEGRALTKKILTRKVIVRGMVMHMKLLKTMQELMAVR